MGRVARKATKAYKIRPRRMIVPYPFPPTRDFRRNVMDKLLIERVAKAIYDAESERRTHKLYWMAEDGMYVMYPLTGWRLWLAKLLRRKQTAIRKITTM